MVSLDGPCELCESEVVKLLRDVNYSCQSMQGARKIQKDGEQARKIEAEKEMNEKQTNKCNRANSALRP